MAARSYYEVLGVTVTASANEIRQGYLARARRLHPDVAGTGDDAAMRRLNEAWAVLRDPARRRAYDREQGYEPSPASYAEIDDDHGFDDVAADLPEDALRPPRRSDFVLLAPAALVVLFAGSLFVGMMVGSAALLALALGSLLLAGVGFVVLPFVTMARTRDRREL